ncbi:MAG TPA: UDP-2,3-diacylglucosamine diphosphatase [Gammaproteobacteria bacterium]|jgi:UDP-2,3-diacylglucosamine pyrophosphatase LpxH|nr:UDP-2,3-diacylglucosamine diphosphatase [Gammaproteobacteria bacterium]
MAEVHPLRGVEHLRTIFVSDVHLGSRACRVHLLLDFLRSTQCETLYLVGDIVDLESLRHDFFWPASHTEVLRLILRKSQEGTRVVYIPGNHDDELRAFVGARFGNVEIARDAIHTTASGRRLLVLHGDEFDAVVRGRSLGVLLGGFACRRLLQLNRFVHWLHDLAGRPYWSLAQHVKAMIPGAQRYIERFRAATLVAAREAAVDGVICGHIHKADHVTADGLTYYNDGDWVESCTVLVEDAAGELALRAWRPTAAAIAATATLAVARERRAAVNAR